MSNPGAKICFVFLLLTEKPNLNADWLHCWCAKDTAEVDFVLEAGQRLILVCIFGWVIYSRHERHNLDHWQYDETPLRNPPFCQLKNIANISLEIFIAEMTGSNLNHDVGYLNFGRTSLLARAKKKLQQVLQDHRPIPIPAEKAQLIQDRLINSNRAESV